MRSAPPSTRKPRWSEEQFAAWLRSHGLEPDVPRGTREPAYSKYNNKIVVVDGAVFHSKGEYARYVHLRLQAKAGLITGLQRQVRKEIAVNGVHICYIVLDFVYWEDGAEVWEDFKGAVTEVFRLKSKLAYAVYGKEIRISKANG